MIIFSLFSLGVNGSEALHRRMEILVILVKLFKPFVGASKERQWGM
jgi:hypothetical protein